MFFNKLPKLKIGSLEAKLPIIQGGMGVGVSLAGLASSVANQGGIGVISATCLGLLKPTPGKNYRLSNTMALRNEIKIARSKTKGILGVNVLAALSDFGDLLLAALEEGIDLFFIGAGLPLHKPQELSEEQWITILKKTIPIISSGRAARIICKHWQRHYNIIPHAFVIEGPLAGGHLGFKKEMLDLSKYSLEKLLTEITLEIRPFESKWEQPISLITAGGIFDGSDIFRFLQLGAQGVQMGTRFVATHECDASDSFKQSYIQSVKEDITIIDSPLGLPGRAIKNEFLENISKGLLSPVKCAWKCLKTCDYKNAPYCISEALKNAQQGILDHGFAFAGETAYRIDKLLSVKELIDTLITEYNKELEYFKEKFNLLQSYPLGFPVLVNSEFA